MKTLTVASVLAALLGSTALAAAQVQFAGLSWGVGFERVRAALTQRGYTLEARKSHEARFGGEILGADTDVYTLFDPAGRLTGVVVWIGSGNGSLNTYAELKNRLDRKYGPGRETSTLPRGSDATRLTALKQGRKLFSVWADASGNRLEGRVLVSASGKVFTRVTYASGLALGGQPGLQDF
ncbi:hypothetical protein HNR42_003088 [Deinobacterium chartae]|uniref:Uncharacterized protein n=1 Tax=Deinobacterium chartae TaxID=521158 RepID=A0A841I730_9DEIO|nr:hypothetical protein [Deinobacterium chartae]MBB6099635.1 hypothetical protein [Deinobacterium chartae]